MATGLCEYTLADGSSRWRAVYRTSNGVLAQRRGFRGPREAQRWRTAMLAAVHRGDVIAMRERSDAWLSEHRPRIEDGTYHDDVRRTAAASCLACGLPLIYVQRQLGHASLSTTEALYGHLEEAFLRHAAERVEQRIWGAAHGRGRDRAGAPAPAALAPVAATAEMLPRALPRPA